MNTNLNTARILLKIGSIIAIIVGIIWTITLVGILWGIPTLIGGIWLQKYNRFNDYQFVMNRTPILIWGIIFLFTTVIGGILTIIAYAISKIEYDSNSVEVIIESSNKMSIEKAYELMQRGIISQEEFEQIKRSHFR